MVVRRLSGLADRVDKPQAGGEAAGAKPRLFPGRGSAASRRARRCESALPSASSACPPRSALRSPHGGRVVAGWTVANPGRVAKQPPRSWPAGSRLADARDYLWRQPTGLPATHGRFPRRRAATGRRWDERGGILGWLARSGRSRRSRMSFVRARTSTPASASRRSALTDRQDRRASSPPPTRSAPRAPRGRAVRPDTSSVRPLSRAERGCADGASRFASDGTRVGLVAACARSVAVRGRPVVAGGFAGGGADPLARARGCRIAGHCLGRRRAGGSPPRLGVDVRAREVANYLVPIRDGDLLAVRFHRRSDRVQRRTSRRRKSASAGDRPARRSRRGTCGRGA